MKRCIYVGLVIFLISLFFGITSCGNNVRQDKDILARAQEIINKITPPILYDTNTGYSIPYNVEVTISYYGRYSGDAIQAQTKYADGTKKELVYSQAMRVYDCQTTIWVSGNSSGFKINEPLFYTKICHQNTFTLNELTQDADSFSWQ
jgi:alpha-L-fucosidase